MGSEEESKSERRLRLSRETLRDLAPAEDDTAAVRGGGTFSTLGGSRESCVPMYETVRMLLGQTSITLGCRGSFTVKSGEDVQEINFQIDPTPEMQQIQEQILRRLQKS